MRADQPITSNVPTDRRYSVGITGASTSDPTKRFGPNVTVTRSAQGVYKYTFSSHPGYFKGYSPGLGADTPSSVKNFSVTRGAFVAATATASAYIELSVWNSSGTATDLTSTQYLDCEFEFSELSV